MAVLAGIFLLAAFFGAGEAAAQKKRSYEESIYVSPAQESGSHYLFDSRLQPILWNKKKKDDEEDEDGEEEEAVSKKRKKKKEKLTKKPGKRRPQSKAAASSKGKSGGSPSDDGEGDAGGAKFGPLKMRGSGKARSGSARRSQVAPSRYPGGASGPAPRGVDANFKDERASGRVKRAGPSFGGATPQMQR